MRAAVPARVPVFALRLAACAALLAILCAPVSADDPVFSGTLETKASGTILTDALSVGDNSLAWSFEESANLRFKATAGEKGTVYGSFNLRAWTADAPAPLVALAEADPSLGLDGEALKTGLSASGELERLYVSLRGETADMDAGLMRVAFGYAPAFRPTDILNPPNPLYPNARPLGVLGAAVSAYPFSDAKVRVLAATRAAGLVGTAELSGTDSAVRPLLGLSADWNARRFSVQPLYLVRLPESAGDLSDQYAGISLKVEAGAGWCFDALWTNEDRDAGLAESVKASVSADWSAFDAKLYLLGQYLWNGPEDRGVNGMREVAERQYAFATVSWQWDDYTRFGLSCLGNLEDLSLAPALTVSHEPFQGMSVGLTGRLFADVSGDKGELSPAGTGTKGSLEAAASLRF